MPNHFHAVITIEYQNKIRRSVLNTLHLENDDDAPPNGSIYQYAPTFPYIVANLKKLEQGSALPLQSNLKPQTLNLKPTYTYIVADLKNFSAGKPRFPLSSWEMGTGREV
ncbi:MAG: hypothetical protein Kow0090_07500 [Myxococcota bacterium]